MDSKIIIHENAIGIAAYDCDPAYSILYSRRPSPPISLAISSIRSSGNGGCVNGFMAMDISFIGLSSAATRLEFKVPHLMQR